MKIKLFTDVAGADFYHARGETVELDDKFARRLIDSGQAEAIKPRAKKKRETTKSTSAETRERAVIE